MILFSEFLFSELKHSLKQFSSILISLLDILIESMQLRLLKQFFPIEEIDFKSMVIFRVSDFFLSELKHSLKHFSSILISLHDIGCPVYIYYLFICIEYIYYLFIAN